MTDRDRILGLLEEIHSLVEENGNADGTLRFDALRAMVALDFAKTEIEKMISGQIPQTEFQDFLREIRVIRVFKVSISTQCAGWHFFCFCRFLPVISGMK